MKELYIEYGEGGFCQNCTEEHPHPLNNIVSIIEVDVQEQP